MTPTPREAPFTRIRIRSSGEARLVKRPWALVLVLLFGVARAAPPPARKTQTPPGPDGPAIQAAIDAAKAQGGGTVRIPCGTYTLTRGGLKIRGSVNLRGSGKCTVLRFATGFPWPDNIHVYVESEGADPTSHTIGTIPGSTTIARGTRVLTFSSAAGLAPGEHVLLFLGTDPNDPNEEWIRMWNVVERVAGSTITFRLGIPEDVPAGARTHKIVEPTSRAENVTISDLAIDEAVGLATGAAVGVMWARGVRVENVTLLHTASSGILVAESENVTVQDVFVLRADDSTHASAGRVANLWGSSNVTFRNVFGFEIDDGIFVESRNRDVVFDDVTLQSGPEATAHKAFFHIVGGSRGVSLRDVRMIADPSVPRVGVNVGIAQGDEVSQEDVTYDGRISGTTLIGVRRGLSYKGKCYEKPLAWSQEFRIRPGETRPGGSKLPRGIYSRMRVFVSTTAGITSFVFSGGPSHAGSADVVGQLVAGRTVDVTLTNGIAGLGNTFNDGGEKRIAVFATASVPPSAHGRVEVEYFPEVDGAKPRRRCRTSAASAAPP
jgi:hypothetical protein